MKRTVGWPLMKDSCGRIGTLIVGLIRSLLVVAAAAAMMGVVVRVVVACWRGRHTKRRNLSRLPVLTRKLGKETSSG